MKTNNSFEKLTRRKVLLAGHSSYAIGGEADYFAAPSSIDDLFFLFDYARKNSLPYFLFGLGANILFPDRPQKGFLFISLKNLLEMGYKNGRLFFSSGVPLSFLALCGAYLRREGLGFTHLLPGTVGAGIYMNARCYEKEISQIAAQVYYTDLNESSHSIRTISPEACCFDYKKSVFQEKNWAILGAEIEAPEISGKTFNDIQTAFNKIKKAAGSLSSLKQFYSFFHKESRRVPAKLDSKSFDEIERDRNGKKHFEYPSCGSVFKNNRALGAPTGKIIEELGLKGLSHGGAMVSPYHGNMIINYRKAKAADIIYLIETLSEKIHEKHGIVPEKEVIIL